MRRNVRSSRGSPRRGAHRLVLLALSLAIPASASLAQTGIPFGPGVVLTYVMHNLDSPADWEFNTTIDSVTPDQTVYLEDMWYPGPNGTTVTAPYRRHVSRREAAGARAIDHGTTCSAADTVDARFRGSTLRMASQRLLRQLKAGTPVEVSSWYHIECSHGLSINGTLQRVERDPVPISILLNDQRLDLQTIHAKGNFRSFDFGIDMDYWFLDDSVRAWMIRSEGRSGQKTYLQQLGRIIDPAEAAKRMAAALSGEAPASEGKGAGKVVLKGGPGPDGMCRAPVYGIYFEFASADLKRASQPTLRQIATVMQQHPDWVLTIEGHTDSIGGAEKNLDLSNRRAAAVRNELVQHYGAAASHLQIKGYGLTRPVEPNATIEGRARNRRVELARTCR
jgi:outer membrane protein OmpA-like peptidoglycan-associated protein